ncbi:hypothetical protein ASL20_09705 [Cupriavidus necator]|uniref:HeH/LEM domain-containing protein n=1 Tax=Cupriavidus necator TaxID=106590 RepID=UPI000735101B|nr:HeH/LEM domain-containing protein [Cupriavidus necator]KUE88890.1 hypothetical protein ASL20_09705 [Cupriavidus necator]
MKVKNTAAFVVTIGGVLVIAPLAVAEVNEEHRGVQVLIRRGVLAPVADADGDTGAGGEPGPQTVAELKQALDALQVEYPENAKKADLQALYDATRGG